MRDLYHNVLATQVLAPVNATTSKTSSTIDMQGFSSANIVFAIGLSADTLSGSVYWTLKLQHSDTDSNYADVTDAETSNGDASIVINSGSLDETSYKIGYSGGKRYVQAVIAATGSHSSGTPVAIVALKGDATYTPVV